MDTHDEHFVLLDCRQNLSWQVLMNRTKTWIKHRNTWHFKHVLMAVAVHFTLHTNHSTSTLLSIQTYGITSRILHGMSFPSFEPHAIMAHDDINILHRQKAYLSKSECMIHGHRNILHLWFGIHIWCRKNVHLIFLACKQQHSADITYKRVVSKRLLRQERQPEAGHVKLRTWLSHSFVWHDTWKIKMNHDATEK